MRVRVHAGVTVAVICPVTVTYELAGERGVPEAIKELAGLSGPTG